MTVNWCSKCHGSEMMIRWWCSKQPCPHCGGTGREPPAKPKPEPPPPDPGPERRQGGWYPPPVTEPPAAPPAPPPPPPADQLRKDFTTLEARVAKLENPNYLAAMDPQNWEPQPPSNRETREGDVPPKPEPPKIQVLREDHASAD